MQANFPPSVQWDYAPDAVSTYLAEAEIDHIPRHEVDADDYQNEDDDLGLLLVLTGHVLMWDGQSDAGVSLRELREK